MPEKRIELIILERLLERLEEEQKKANEQLLAIDNRVRNLAHDVSHLQGENVGSSKPRGDPHWLIRFVVASLLVLSISALVALAYRSIDRRLENVESYIRDNRGLIAGLHLQQEASKPVDA
jgi:hypothetical protein